MARYDIAVDTNYGDIELPRSSASRYITSIKLLGAQDGLDNDHFCYAEVLLPKFRSLSYSVGDTILVQGQYNAVDKPVKVRFLLDNDNEAGKEYVINKYDNSIWFQASSPDNNLINFCMLTTINEESLFELVFTENGVVIYSGYETDMKISPSLSQNKNLLLMTRMGSCHKHPLTGVGLVDYLNSNMKDARLADKLQSEFLNDGMVVVDAAINTETGELDLIVEE